MSLALKKAIDWESEEELLNFLEFRNDGKIDRNQYHLIEKALSGKWHNQHEDLVCMVHLEDLKDDRFVEPVLNIAFNKEIFRPYDLELESTLRKCVHALKTIDSEKSNLALKKLERLNNENVNFVLEMYE